MNAHRIQNCSAATFEAYISTAGIVDYQQLIDISLRRLGLGQTINATSAMGSLVPLAAALGACMITLGSLGIRHPHQHLPVNELCFA